MKDIYWEQNSFMKDFAKEQRSLMKTKDITKKQSSITKDIMYRVFIKYCVFSKNSRKFATIPSPALGCYWLYKNYKPMDVTVHSHCDESFESLLQRYRRYRRYCSEF